jgi:hypothetical protein
MRCRGEEGVTLEDLLIAMVITGILMFPLMAAMFTVTHTLGATESRIDQSNRAALVASYFAPDVENATSVATNAMEPATCTTPQTVSLLLMTATGSVSYYMNGSTLYRRTCGTPAIGPVRLARNLAGAPTFQINPTGATSNWTSVTASMTQIDPLDPTNVAKQYTTNVQGTRRVS